VRPSQTASTILPFDPTRFAVEGVWARYGIALAAFLSAVAARLALDWLVPGQLQFLTFFPS
jgi:hypothetical protein